MGLLVREGLPEDIRVEGREDLGRDASREIDPGAGDAPEREIPGLGAEDRDEHLERAGAPGTGAAERGLADAGGKPLLAAGLGNVLSPGFLSRAGGCAGAGVAPGVRPRGQPREAGAREHRLVAHASLPLAERAEEIDLVVRPRREVRVAPLGGYRDELSPDPRQGGLAEPGSRCDQGGVPLGSFGALLDR